MPEDIDHDVIVIGAGGAGLSAAVSAAELGARVLVLESEGAVGGSTALSAGMFTAAGTSVQAALGIEDGPEQMFHHYMDLNQWRLRPGLVRAFCEEAAPTLEWLLELGLEVPPQLSSNAHQPGLGQGGVGEVWRSHVPKDEGYGLVEVLHRSARQHGVEIVLHTHVERLLVEGGAVVGVVADGTEVRSHAVVVASGGLSHDRQLLEEYYPRALEAGDALFAVASPGHRGDHLRFGSQVGASVVGEGWGLLLLTAYFQRHHHWQAGFPPQSRIYVDTRGRRFVNEDVSYAVSTGILDDHGGRAWAVFDEAGRVSLPAGYVDWDPDRILAEARAGRTLSADTLEGLAEAMGVPARALVRGVAEWNSVFPEGRDDTDFLRHETLAAKGSAGPLAPIGQPPYYAVLMQPGELVCTHAGLEIDGHGAVVGASGDLVPGLFAAGESGGGILGEAYVGGGNSVANAVTMGRLAGRAAAARALSS